LKEEVIKAQNEQRKNITQTIQEFWKYLQHMNEVEKQTEKNYEEFLIERIETDWICNERELSDADKISSLSDEISSLKFKIRELEANNKEREFLEIRSELVKRDAELSHAKQSLVNTTHTLKVMEEKVASWLSDIKGRFDFNDEILRLWLENQRLHEENKSLLLSQSKVQDDLNTRIDELTKKLFVKTEECDELQSKYWNLLTTLNAERQEEVKSWLRRQDVIKRSIAELKHQLDDTRNRRETSLIMKDEEHKLLADEVKLLRSEANKLQAFWESQFNDWVSEKHTLTNEIQALWESLSSVESYYKESTDIKQKEIDVLHSHS